MIGFQVCKNRSLDKLKRQIFYRKSFRIKESKYMFQSEQFNKIDFMVLLLMSNKKFVFGTLISSFISFILNHKFISL